MTVTNIKNLIDIYDPIFFIKNILITEDLILFPLLLFIIVLIVGLLIIIGNFFGYINNLITKPILKVLRDGAENAIKNVSFKDIFRTIFPYSVVSSIIVFSIMLGGLIGLMYYIEKNAVIMTNERQRIADTFKTPVRDEVIKLLNINFATSSLDIKKKLFVLYLLERKVLNNELEKKYTIFMKPVAEDSKVEDVSTFLEEKVLNESKNDVGSELDSKNSNEIMVSSDSSTEKTIESHHNTKIENNNFEKEDERYLIKEVNHE